MTSQTRALRRLIKRSGLSITAWAKQVELRTVGVNPRTVRRWLAGTSPIPEQVWAHQKPEGQP